MRTNCGKAAAKALCDNAAIYCLKGDAGVTAQIRVATRVEAAVFGVCPISGGAGSKAASDRSFRFGRRDCSFQYSYRA